MFGDSERPLLIWGDSGSGKTSVMAKAFTLVCKNFEITNFEFNSKKFQLKSWIASHNGDTDTLKMIRFIGTSQSSSRTVPLLTSLCQQTYYFLRQPAPLNLPTDPVSLISYFKNLLTLASSHKTVFLFLDSLDQLYFTDQDRYFFYLQMQLSKNCKIIYSVVTEHMEKHNLTQTYENLLEIPPLGKVQGLAALRYETSSQV